MLRVHLYNTLLPPSPSSPFPPPASPFSSPSVRLNQTASGSGPGRGPRRIQPQQQRRPSCGRTGRQRRPPPAKHAAGYDGSSRERPAAKHAAGGYDWPRRRPRRSSRRTAGRPFRRAGGAPGGTTAAGWPPRGAPWRGRQRGAAAAGGAVQRGEAGAQHAPAAQHARLPRVRQERLLPVPPKLQVRAARRGE